MNGYLPYLSVGNRFGIISINQYRSLGCEIKCGFQDCRNICVYILKASAFTQVLHRKGFPLEAELFHL
ncbi:hypothetical protein FKM82_018185 [Ascaphus truei]